MTPESPSEEKAAPKLVIKSLAQRGERVALRALLQNESELHIEEFHWHVNGVAQETRKNTLVVPIDKQEIQVSVKATAGAKTFEARVTIQTRFEVTVTPDEVPEN
jgi:hypothetical protein